MQEAMSVGFSGVSKTVYTKGLLNGCRRTAITLTGTMAFENRSLKSAFEGYSSHIKIRSEALSCRPYVTKADIFKTGIFAIPNSLPTKNTYSFRRTKLS